jgi:hypothetical protein
MIDISTKIFNETNRIKPKLPSQINKELKDPKVFFTSRPKSLEKLKRNSSISATSSKI